MTQLDSVFLYLHRPKTGGSTLGPVIYLQYHDGSDNKEAPGYLRAGIYSLPDGLFRDPGEKSVKPELLETCGRASAVSDDECGET